MTGIEAWDAIQQRLGKHYNIECKAAGYEGQRWEVQQSRQHADTSMYMTIRGDCPEHYEDMHYECYATITVRLSDHESGRREPDYSLYYDEDDIYDNADELQLIIDAAEAMPQFNEEADTQRRNTWVMYDSTDGNGGSCGELLATSIEDVVEQGNVKKFSNVTAQSNEDGTFVRWYPDGDITVTIGGIEHPYEVQDIA